MIASLVIEKLLIQRMEKIRQEAGSLIDNLPAADPLRILLDRYHRLSTTPELRTVTIQKPDDLNFILGQAHFIKTVEDLHETLAQSSPSLKFLVT